MATKRTTRPGGENRTNPGAKDAPRKPLVFATNPFDDDRLDAIEAAAENWDGSYVPGYSETRRENELKRARGEEPTPIPKLYWARVNSEDGSFLQETDEGMMQVMQLGYRACGQDDLEEHGWGMPPTASVSENGLIRRGDAALFIVGTERAARNRERQNRINERVMQDRVGETGEVYRPEGESVEKRGSLKEISEMDPSL